MLALWPRSIGHAELKMGRARVRHLLTISPNYTIPTPTVSVLTSTYAKIKINQHLRGTQGPHVFIADVNFNLVKLF